MSPRVSYRQLNLIVLIPGHKRPPALHPLLLEDGNGGKLVLVFDHVEGTLLGRLGSAREPVQVQLDGTCGRVDALVL